MHASLREIIDTRPCCRDTIREASQYLPEDGEELDAWIAGTLEEKDQLAFCYLVVGAIHRGLPVASRHLDLGLKYLPGFEAGCHMIMHATGDDVPERVARALQLGAISPYSHASYLTALWHCCADRGIPFPEPMLKEARGMAHKCRKTQHACAAFLHFAMLANDLRMQEMLFGSPAGGEDREELEKASAEMDAAFGIMLGRDIIESISETPRAPLKPKTFRRAVGHIGRNDPCPCGSGKKHKRCCFEKTRDRLLHSSDVAGMTMKELYADPEAHMTAARLKEIDPGLLIKLDPLKLDRSLIPRLVGRLSGLRLFDDATSVLEKTGLSDEVQEQWENLMILAAEMRRKNVVRRLVALYDVPEDQEEKDYLHVCPRLLLAEDDAGKTLEILKETAGMLVEAPNPGALYFHGMGFVTSPLGALGIMLAQAAVAQLEIEHALDLLDIITKRRAELDLPLEDPLTAIFDKRIAAEARKEENKDSAKLTAAMRRMDALAEKERKSAEAARQMEKELAKLTKEAAGRKAASPVAQPPDDSGIKALREKLRIHEANEKVNAEERAAHRRATSELLLLEEKLREQARPAKPAPAPRDDGDEEDRLIKGELQGTQPLRTTAFPDKFLKSLGTFPRHVGRQTMALLGRIASGEPAAFHDVLRLKACHDVFRARVGIDHRLLFRLHAEEVEVIALIDRRDLDARIKTLRKHA